jgi:predicted alpha/beta-fold hydrolase
MPLIEESSYKAPDYLKSAHLQTIYPTLLRRIKDVNYRRKTINTPDGDFIDIDISSVNSDKLVILTHGLEGSSKQSYIKGMVKFYNKRGYDCAAINMRSCSGRLNKLHRFYHMGSSDDLKLTVDYMNTLSEFSSIFLIGFSMGGNITAKYLGEHGDSLPKNVKKAVLFSTPICLLSTAPKIERWENILYKENFLYTLKKKILDKRKKSDKFPINKEIIYKIKTFSDFDDFVTAPLHGFKNAKEYWKKTSSIHFIKGIKIPTLLVNAKNDPLLGEHCYPHDIAKNHDKLYLETPTHGGHVGFILMNKEDEYWSERRSYEFFTSL